MAIPTVMQLLKQASCYGNHDATFMLSAILNNGVGVKAQEAMVRMNRNFHKLVFDFMYIPHVAYANFN